MCFVVGALFHRDYALCRHASIYFKYTITSSLHHRQLLRSCVEHFAQRKSALFCTANPRDLKKYRKFKMAKRNILEIDYAQLNDFSSVVMFNTTPRRKRKTLPGAYSVERIISRRSINNVSYTESYSLFHCQMTCWSWFEK